MTSPRNSATTNLTTESSQVSLASLQRAERHEREELYNDLTVKLRRQEVARYRQGAEVGGKWIPGPLYWLRYAMGDDNEAKGLRTFDHHWRDKKTEPFPRFPGPETHPYLPWLFSLFMSERRLFVPKSRDMMASWCAIAYAVWLCHFWVKTKVIVQTQKEPKVIELIKGLDEPGYARTLYEQQPAWLQRQSPLSKPMSDQSQTLITWAHGSSIQGVPSGEGQLRLPHPSLIVFDEAAHLDEFQAAYGNADLISTQVIAVSSAGPSWFSDICERL